MGLQAGVEAVAGVHEAGGSSAKGVQEGVAACKRAGVFPHNMLVNVCLHLRTHSVCSQPTACACLHAHMRARSHTHTHTHLGFSLGAAVPIHAAKAWV